MRPGPVSFLAALGIAATVGSAASLEQAHALLQARQQADTNATELPSTAVSSSEPSSPGSKYNDAGFWRGGPELATAESPFYPATGNGGWEWAYQEAKSLVSQMTLEEKVNLTTGVASAGRCEGTLGTVERFGIPALCFQDGPAGFRTSDFVTVFPAGVTTAATWNRQLIYDRAAALGAEFKGKGVVSTLAPSLDLT